MAHDQHDDTPPNCATEGCWTPVEWYRIGARWDRHCRQHFAAQQASAGDGKAADAKPHRRGRPEGATWASLGLHNIGTLDKHPNAPQWAVHPTNQTGQTNPTTAAHQGDLTTAEASINATELTAFEREIMLGDVRRRAEQAHQRDHPAPQPDNLAAVTTIRTTTTHPPGATMVADTPRPVVPSSGSIASAASTDRFPSPAGRSNLEEF